MVALKSDTAAEKSKDQLSRDFPGRSIFDFCNNIPLLAADGTRRRNMSRRATSGLMRCSKLRLLVDHLVCAGERRRGKIEAEHFSGLEVDDQLVFGRRLQCEHFKQP